MPRLVPLLLTCGLLLVSGSAAVPVTFVDVTNLSGIQFTHNSGAFGSKYMPETFGSGVVWLDFNSDGQQDLLFVNSTEWPERNMTGTVASLYLNEGDGKFTDITQNSGLDIPMYGIGATAADFDNDGNIDVYVTSLGPNRLFKGHGDGTFTDVTLESGVGDPGFSTSALWFDYDRDGHLDLFVANYIEWSIDTDLFCSLVGETKSYCTPESYQGQSPTLYRNRGDLTFEDVTRDAGLHVPSSKGLGVAMLDFNNDDWVDLFIANDTQPNQLYQNKGNGTFEDVGVLSGVAFSETGVARAGMGVDASDYDGSGRPSLIIGNFSAEMMAMYRNEGNGLFIDEAPRSALGRATLTTLTFGCFFFDVDLDGWPDIFAANGHIADDVERIQSRITYAQPPQLFINRGQGNFEEITSEVGNELKNPMVGRGTAYADFDNDGDLDIVITANGGRARLLRNDGTHNNHVLRVKTIGVESNRDGIGARVELNVNGETRWQRVKTGSSYASQSELPVTFGLGNSNSVTAVHVSWPSGKTDVIENIDVDQMLTIQEGTGIVSAVPLS